MKYIVLFFVIVGIIYGITSIQFNEQVLTALKILVFLLVSAGVFALLGLLFFKTLFTFLWKTSLLLAGCDLLYMLFRQLFSKKF